MSDISANIKANVVGKKTTKIKLKKQSKEQNSIENIAASALLSFRDNIGKDTSDVASEVSDVSQIAFKGQSSRCLFCKIDTGEALFLTQDNRIFRVPLGFLPEDAEIGSYIEFNLNLTGRNIKDDISISEINSKYIKK